MLKGIELFACGDKNMPIGTVIPVDEETAPWEREVQAAILGHRILADFLNSKNSGYIVNLSCSRETIQELFDLRKITVNILSSEHGSFSSDEVKVAGEILVKLDAVSVRPLNIREKKLLVNMQKAVFEAKLPFTGSFTCGQPVHHLAACTTGTAVNFSPQLKLKSAECHNQYGHTPKKVTCGKCFYDISFIDLYRIFFYVKDSTGNDGHSLLTYNCGFSPSLSSAFHFKSYISSLNIIISNTGAFS
jgi:hypothetical protein